MAIIQFDINNQDVPRIKEAYKNLLEVGDAVDLENPTNDELVAKLKSVAITNIRAIVLSFERTEAWKLFDFKELDIT